MSSGGKNNRTRHDGIQDFRSIHNLRRERAESVPIPKDGVFTNTENALRRLRVTLHNAVVEIETESDTIARRFGNTFDMSETVWSTPTWERISSSVNRSGGHSFHNNPFSSIRAHDGNRRLGLASRPRVVEPRVDLVAPFKGVGYEVAALLGEDIACERRGRSVGFVRGNVVGARVEEVCCGDHHGGKPSAHNRRGVLKNCFTNTPISLRVDTQNILSGLSATRLDNMLATALIRPYKIFCI